MNANYISCFSGIGGLEADHAPDVLCEMDPACRVVLRSRYPESTLVEDICLLHPPKAEIVAGGWPCQDLSIAGHQVGLAGPRSGLLAELLRVGKEARADTIIAENVANLLRMNGGNEFADALAMFHSAGFRFVSWRILNARHFGLPQHRNRLLLVASNDEDCARSLFRSTPEMPESDLDETKADLASGFYWTAGTHSINYSRGYVPTVKIGSSIKIASPPAVHYDKHVRTLSSEEALRLQGFDGPFHGVSATDQYRMAGNAVPRPIGQWVFEGVMGRIAPKDGAREEVEQLSLPWGSPKHPRVGLSCDGRVIEFAEPKEMARAVNLIDFLDLECEASLSRRAARGLLSRLERSNQACPEDLRGLLRELARGVGE